MHSCPYGGETKARPVVRAGRGGRSRSVAVLLAAARPDQGVAVVLVVEEVGVDRRVEARIVQLERKVIAALVGALGPGGPDLDPADIDPVAGGIAVAAAGLGTMRTPLAWRLRVTISPWNSLPTFLKEPMLAMSLLLAVFEPATTAASMAIGRPETIDDAPAPRAGAQRRMTAEGLSCLARNGLQPRGRKSMRRRCGSGDRGAAGLRPDQAKERPSARVL